MQPILYLHLKKKIELPSGTQVQLKDICHLSGDGDLDWLQYVPVYEPQPADGNFVVLQALDIIRLIQAEQPKLDIRNIGPAHIIIEIKQPSRIPNFLSLSLVWLLLFTGSGLAIMNFHTDVSMREVHQRIYYLVTGLETTSPLTLQIPYSIGIGLGMILFFNHLFKHRLHEEPSPMELEMFQYQETIDQYLIEQEKKKLERISHDSPP